MSLNVQMKVDKFNLFIFPKILKAYFEVFKWLKIVLNTDEYIFGMVKKVLLISKCIFNSHSQNDHFNCLHWDNFKMKVMYAENKITSCRNILMKYSR